MLFASGRTFYLSILYFSYFFISLYFSFWLCFCILLAAYKWIVYVDISFFSLQVAIVLCCVLLLLHVAAVYVGAVCRKLCEWQMTKQKPVVVQCVMMIKISLSAVCLSLPVFVCGIQGAACNKLQCQWQWQLLLDWSTNLAYCTTFHRKRQTLRWSTLIAHWLTFVVCFVFTSIVSFVVAVPARCCCCFSCCCCCRCCH